VDHGVALSTESVLDSGSLAFDGLAIKVRVNALQDAMGGVQASFLYEIARGFGKGDGEDELEDGGKGAGEDLPAPAMGCCGE
jgi:hypothetical protein